MNLQLAVTALQRSIGKLNVTNIQPTSATLGQLSTPITCSGFTAAVIPVLAPGEDVVCTASYVFDQGSLESGLRVFTANFSTGSELGAPLVPASVTVSPQLTPAVTAMIADSSCIKPTKAGMVCCAGGWVLQARVVTFCMYGVQ